MCIPFKDPIFNLKFLNLGKNISFSFFLKDTLLLVKS